LTERPNLATAIRCVECGTLFEVPDIEKQSDETKKLYAEIMTRMRFPCPDCGHYQNLRGTGPRMRIL